MAATAAADTVKDAAPTEAPGEVKMAAGDWVNGVATPANKKPLG